MTPACSLKQPPNTTKATGRQESPTFAVKNLVSRKSASITEHCGGPSLRSSMEGSESGQEEVVHESGSSHHLPDPSDGAHRDGLPGVYAPDPEVTVVSCCG